MLGYNEGQVLEPFKNTSPTRYHYLLFDIQNLIKAVESTMHIMTKEKLDKQLAGQSSAPYISLKTHPSKNINLSNLMNMNCWTSRLTGKQRL